MLNAFLISLIYILFLICIIFNRKRQEKLEQKAKEKEAMDDDYPSDFEEPMEEVSYRRKTERELELELECDYSLDLKKNYDFKNPDWKYDIIPEHWNGHNIADYIDPEIMEKLDALEKEEEERESSGFYDLSESEDEDGSYAEIKDLAQKIRYKKGLMKADRFINHGKQNMPRDTLPKKRSRSVSRLKSEFENLGVDMTDVKGAHFTRTEENEREHRPVKRARLEELERSKRADRSKSGIRDEVEAKKLRKITKKTQQKMFNRYGKIGESDKSIAVKKPRHLFAGKRKSGKTDRR